MSQPQNLLIVRLSSIGDVVLTSALVRCVRKQFPDARIAFLVKKQFADLVKYNLHIDEVIAFDSKTQSLRELSQTLRSKQFDWLIDIHKNLRTTYLKLFSGIPETTTYNKQTLKRRLLVNFRIHSFSTVKPVFLRYFEAVENQGVVYDGSGTELFFPEEIGAEVEEKLGSARWTPDQKILALAPAASYSNKQWYPERFAETANRLAGKHRAFVVLIGGPSDKLLCERISTLIKYPFANWAGELSLLHSAALLKKASLALTNDSGMMHLAQSQKTPVVAIFGATTRELGFFPLPEKSMVVEKPVKCRPCTAKGLNHCPKKHFNCMRLITVDEVEAAADTLLLS